MKIAICLSGLARTYRSTYQNFIDNILSVNKGHHIDTFISTWSIEKSNNSMEYLRQVLWYGDQAVPLEERPIDFNDIYSKYVPVSMTVESPLKFDQSWYTELKGVHIQSLLSMTYKIYNCDMLRRNYELINGFKYDVVIRMRMDTLMPFPLDVAKLDLSVITMPSMMQNKIDLSGCLQENVKPVPDYQKLDWANDKFAVGNSDNMAIYCNWFLNFSNLILGGIPVQPETLLAAHLNQHNVKYNPWGTEMEIIR